MVTERKPVGSSAGSVMELSACPIFKVQGQRARLDGKLIRWVWSNRNGEWREWLAWWGEQVGDNNEGHCASSGPLITRIPSSQDIPFNTQPLRYIGRGRLAFSFTSSSPTDRRR